MPPKTKASATNTARKKFEEAFAKDMGRTLMLASSMERYDVIPTGSLDLDFATGVGGWPTGRVVEIWGPEAVGKSTLAILTAVQAQQKFPEKMIAWVDMEQTFDEEWATKLGLDLSRVYLEYPEDAEDVADAVKRFVRSGICSLVVLDSVGGMISRIEFEKEADEVTVAAVAKVVTRMVKQCAPLAKSNDTLVMVINQVRSKIGGYGPDTTTSGGWALRHVTSMKMAVRRGGDTPKSVRLHGDNVIVGKQVAVRVEKNKVAPPGLVGKFWLFDRATEKFGPEGVDPVAEAVTVAKKVGVLSGTWMDLPDGERVQGAEKAVEYLRANPKVLAQVRDQVLEVMRSKASDSDGQREITSDEQLEAFLNGEED